MGVALRPSDDGLHPVGPEHNWNESRYLDGWDHQRGLGLWLRLGMRPNEGRAEVSVCIYLPDGSVACTFPRPAITTHGESAGGLQWQVDRPFEHQSVDFTGRLRVLQQPWDLARGGAALAAAPEVDAHISLQAEAGGLTVTLGADQDDVQRIFVPGQAHGHHQQLARTVGRITLAGRTYDLEAHGATDHSWGPRNWHAKMAFRWLIGRCDDGDGFLLTRSVSQSHATRGGVVIHQGDPIWVERFHLDDVLSRDDDHRLLGTTASIEAGPIRWRATGTPMNGIPLRNRQRDADGVEQVLRIAKYPTEWRLDDGRAASGMCEYHDLLIGGVPRGDDDP